VLPVHFLTDDYPLRVEDAVAAIITVEDGRYLLQLRDDIPRIFYPGHWGCFGGAVGDGEQPAQALMRELEEELEMKSDVTDDFVSLDFDLSRLGQKRVYRTYYEIVASESAVSKLVLHEGSAMRLFEGRELFDLPNVTPYDSLALWLHFARHRFQAAPRTAG
jgi:8-oxo-dGTP pyrophosphatase MutT (NUDIX family)